MMEAKNISYSVRGKDILNDVSAAFPAGKITAILGPNGAGKSSLLHCLAGASTYDSGAVLLEGQDIKSYSLDALSKRKAVLSQSQAIEFPFTVQEIVTMGRAPFARSTYARDDHDIVMAALGTVEALHLKDRIFPTLSGGEKQRVHLARVQAQLWAQDGAYLLLDEPTSALDLKHQYMLMKRLRVLTSAQNFGVIIVLHDLNLATNFADSVIFMKNGQIAERGDSPAIITTQMISDIYDITPQDAAAILG